MKMRSFFNPEEKKETQRLLPGHLIKDFLIPLGSLLFVAIPILTSQRLLPNWAIYLIPLYVTFVIGVVVWTPLSNTISFFLGRQREKQHGKNFFPCLQKSAQEFDEFIEWHNTILDWLLKINQWDELKNKKIQINAGYIVTFRDWHSSIKEHFNFYRYEDYRHIAHELSVLILRYHNLCIEIQHQLERLVYPVNDRGMVEPSILSEQHLRVLKQEWGLRKERQMLFINEWEKLAKEINGTPDKRICIDNYEQLKTL